MKYNYANIHMDVKFFCYFHWKDGDCPNKMFINPEIIKSILELEGILYSIAITQLSGICAVFNAYYYTELSQDLNSL